MRFDLFLIASTNNSTRYTKLVIKMPVIISPSVIKVGETTHHQDHAIILTKRRMIKGIVISIDKTNKHPVKFNLICFISNIRK